MNGNLHTYRCQYYNYYVCICAFTVTCLCNSCFMGKGSLPDVYTQCMRAAGQRAEDVHIYQANHECPCCN